MNKGKNITKGNISSNSNSFGDLKIANDGGQFVFFIGRTQMHISHEEFSLIREGTIPISIKAVLEQNCISQEHVIRAAREVVQREYFFEIARADGIQGYIRNGHEGLVQRRKVFPPAKEEEPPKVIYSDLIRFDGQIGPVYLIDGETRGLGLKLNGIQYAPMPMSDFYSLIRQELSVPGLTMQKLKEVINSWVQRTIENGEAVEYRTSPIFVEEGIIKVDFPYVGDLQDILARLRNFHDKASHPLAYRTVFAWSLLAPLHDELKRHADVSRRVQTPQVMMAGKTQGGKTPLGDFFVGKGYAMAKDAYFYPYQTVRTTFTLMRHLGETNLPALFDDLPGDWLTTHADDLKAYVQTGHFGDRGKSDQTVQSYRGRRSFMGTVNSSIRIDDDLAASMRIIILRFTEQNRRRKNLPEWNNLIDGVPDGFMLEIFRVMFESQKIKDIAMDAERFQTPADWINYILGKLNMLSQWYGLQQWDLYKEDSTADQDTNAIEIAQSFLTEWARIQRNSEDAYNRETDQSIKAIKYRSPIEGDFCVEWHAMREYIYFTPGAFKTILARLNLRLPYRTASDFLNNVSSSDNGVRVEDEGQLKSKKIQGMPLKTFCISVPVWGDDDDF